jgi:hypothetical protein
MVEEGFLIICAKELFNMPIPNAISAYVPSEKLSGYLLNGQHPVGGTKAKWFRSLGYNSADALEQDLLKLVRASEEFAEKKSSFGTKYVVSGKIAAPNGSEVNLKTVWIVESPDIRPRLVTAFPGEKT